MKEKAPRPIFYRRGYKYQIVSPYKLDLSEYGLLTAMSEYPGASVGTAWVSLSEGVLRFEAGYAWDGSSGLARDTRKCMRGSLAHDGLYQLIRVGALPRGAREIADKIYYDLLREDGTWPLRASWRAYALRWFGGGASTAPPRQVFVAP